MFNFHMTPEAEPEGLQEGDRAKRRAVQGRRRMRH